MHKYSCIILVLFVLSCSRTPQKQAVGIGRFIPGVTTIAVIDSLKKELGMDSIKAIQYMSEYYPFDTSTADTMGLVQLVSCWKEPVRSIPQVFYCKQARLFNFNYLKVEGLTLHMAELVFYHDTLAEFACEPTLELHRYMLARCGKPLLVTNEEDSYTEFNNPPLQTSFYGRIRCKRSGERMYDGKFVVREPGMMNRLLDCNQLTLEALK